VSGDPFDAKSKHRPDWWTPIILYLAFMLFILLIGVAIKSR
jgi:hypothetical protein